MKDDFKKVNSFLGGYLKANGLEDTFLEREINKLWPQLVGPMFARYTKGIYFRRGVVYIAMTSAMARNELLMKKSSLIGAINKQLREKSVKDVVIR